MRQPSVLIGLFATSLSLSLQLGLLQWQEDRARWIDPLPGANVSLTLAQPQENRHRAEG